MLMIDCLRDRKERLQLAKRKQENLADEVKLLKQGGLVGDDSVLDSEMLNPKCLEPAQCPVAVASGIQTASSEKAEFQAMTSGPQLGDYAQADEELDVVEEGIEAANLGSGLEKGDFESEPLDLELDEISRGNSIGTESLNSPHASKLQSVSLDELEVQSIILDFFFLFCVLSPSMCETCSMGGNVACIVVSISECTETNDAGVTLCLSSALFMTLKFELS